MRLLAQAVARAAEPALIMSFAILAMVLLLPAPILETQAMRYRCIG